MTQIFHNNQYGNSKTNYNNKTDIVKEKNSGKSFITSKRITNPIGLGFIRKAKISQKNIVLNAIPDISSVSKKSFPNNGTASEIVEAVDAYIAEASEKVVQSEICNNPYKETFYDKDGNIVKTDLLHYPNGITQIYSTTIEFNPPLENGITSVTKSKNQIEIKVSKPVVNTPEGIKQFNRGYKEFDINGNILREVYANVGAYKRIPDTYEIKYRDGKSIAVKQEIFTKDGSKVITFIDYEKGTKRIEKSDKKWNIYKVSETGINDEPEFITKQDIIRRSTDVWVGFPTMKQAVSDANFDCVSVQTIVETLRKNPEACDKIIKLKNPDGTPRFAPEDAATLILNCSKYIDSPRLMKFITTPKADGTQREVYEIFRGYVDSDEFKDVAPTPAAPAETETSPVDTMVLESMAKPEVKSYIERIVNTKGYIDALKEIYHEFDNMPDTPENKALVSGIVKCFMSGGQNTEHVADFVKTELTKIHTEEVAKEAALASINKDAVLSDEVYAAAFELSPQVSATDKRHVADLMKAKASIVEKMMTYKNSDGSQMFPPKIVAEFFLNCESVITSDPVRIFTTIESDLFQKTYADWENKSAALWKCLYY